MLPLCCHLIPRELEVAARQRRAQGEGTCVERSPNVWQVQLRVGTGSDGKSQRITRTVHGSKAQAQKVLRSLSKADAVPVRGDATVEELLRSFLDSKGPTLGAATATDYAVIIDRWLVPNVGKVKAARLGVADVDKLMVKLSAKLSPSRVRRAHSILSASYKLGMRWGVVPANPVALSSPPPIPRNEPKAPARDLVEQVLTACDEADGYLFGLYIRMAVGMGLRRGELAGLQWSDVDYSTGRLTVQRALTYAPSTGVQVKSTKTNRVRRVTIPPSLLHRLSETYTGILRPGDVWMFSDTADPPRPDRFTQAYERVCKRLGISTHLHALRHYHLTSLVAGGVDIRTVAERAGHSNPAVTLRVYSSWVPAADEAAAALFDGL